MKKFFCFVVKLVAVCTLLAGAAFAVVAYWDKLTELYARARYALAEKKKGCCHCRPGDEEYEDWEE